jgi:hypothetical protein
MTDLPVATVPPLDLTDPTNAVSGVREHVPREFVFGKDEDLGL